MVEHHLVVLYYSLVVWRVEVVEGGDGMPMDVEAVAVLEYCYCLRQVFDSGMVE